MSTPDGEVRIGVVADTSGAQRQIERDLTNSGKSSSKSFATTFGSVATKGMKVAGAGIAGILGVSLAKGFGRLSAIDQAQRKLEGLGYSAGDVQKVMDNSLASVKGTAFGLGEAASLAAGAVAAGVKPGKDLTRTLKIMADTATIAGTDLNDMQNVFGKVIAQGKLTGETLQQLQERGVPVGPMLAKSLGIPLAEVQQRISEGKVSFKEFQVALEDSLGGARLSGGKTVVGAVKNIGAALSRLGAGLLGGIFSRLPGLFANVIKWIDQVTPAAKKIGESLGDAFGKAYDAVLKFAGNPQVRKAVLDLFEGIKGGISVIVPALQDFGRMLLANILPPLKAILPPVLAFGRTLLSIVGPAIAGVLNFLTRFQGYIIPLVVGIGAMVLAWTAFQKIMLLVRAAGVAYAAVQATINAVMMANPIGLIVLALVGLGAALVVAWKKSETFRNIVKGAWEGIKSAVSAVSNWFMTNVWPTLTKVWDGIKKGLGALVSAVKVYVQTWWNVFSTAMNAIRNVISKVWGWIGPYVTGVMSAVRTIISRYVGLWLSAFGKIRDIISKVVEVFSSARDTVGEWMGKIKSKIEGLVDGLVTPFRGIVSKVEQVGRDIITGIWRGISGMWSWLTGKVREVATSLFQAAKDALGISSPSRLFATIGANVIAGLVKGLDDNKHKVKAAAKKVTDQMNEAMADAKQTIKDFQQQGRDLGQSISRSLGLFGENTADYLARLNEASTPDAAAGLLANMKASLKAVDSWRASLDNVQKRGLPKSIVEELRAMGTDSADELYALNKMTDAQLKEFASLWRRRDASGAAEGAKQVVDDITSVVSSVEAKFKTLGENAMAGLAKGLKSKGAAVKRRIQALMADIIEQARDALGIASPSKAFADELGRWILPGVAQGIEASRPAFMRDLRGLVPVDSMSASMRAFGRDAGAPAGGTNVEVFIGDERLEARMIRVKDRSDTAAAMRLAGAGVGS